MTICSPSSDTSNVTIFSPSSDTSNMTVDVDLFKECVPTFEEQVDAVLAVLGRCCLACQALGDAFEEVFMPYIEQMATATVADDEGWKEDDILLPPLTVGQDEQQNNQESTALPVPPTMSQEEKNQLKVTQWLLKKEQKKKKWEARELAWKV